MKNQIKLVLVFWILLIVQITNGQSIQQLGPNYYVAGVPTNEFEFWASPQVNGIQRQTNWCWAACIQMVLNYHGLYVQQEEIVTRIYGQIVDQPAGEQQIRIALSGWAPNVQGGISNIFCQSGITGINDITNNLIYKWPLIVGLRNPSGNIGHAYVLTAIYYSTDMFNNTVPDKVVLRDPWPGNQSRQEISWNDFQFRLQMIFKVWVSR